MSTVTIDSTLGTIVNATETLKRRHYRSDRMRRRLAEAIDYLARGVWHVWRNRQYLSAIKLANMAMINAQCRLQTERVVGMPYRMKIEPTNVCNTHCQLCPTGIGLTGRAKGKMDFDQFQKLIDQLRRYLYTVDLSMWGDPLIVPDIYRMIRYAHDAGIWTYLSSNLHAFKPERGHADALVRSHLDMLTCSLHGASQATFEAYQPGKKFDHVVEKIKAIVAAKRRLRSDTPEIQLNFVVTKANQHEKAAFAQLAESLDCKPVFSAPSLNVRFLNRDNDLVPLGLSEEVLAERIAEHIERWLPNDDEHVVGPYKLIKDGKYRSDDYNGRKLMDCQWPWKDCVINWDGSVVTCCGVYETDHDMGNVFHQPLHAIWNSPSYRQARRSFKRSVGEPTDHANPCRDCPGFLI